MLVSDHRLADMRFLRSALLTGLVLLSATVVRGQTNFSNCVVPLWGEYSNEVVVSNNSTTTPTCDLLYKALQPSYFTALGSSHLPQAGSLEYLPNGVFSFMNVYTNTGSYTGAPATVWVQKGAAQNGITIIDDNANDNDTWSTGVAGPFAPYSSLNIALYNVPANLTDARYGIHVHVDPSSGNQQHLLYGIAVGAHATNSTGLGINASGNGSTGIFSFEGDGTESEAGFNTTSYQTTHFTDGYIFNVTQQVSTMNGDVLRAAMAEGSGQFLGNFLNFLNGTQQEFKVDAQGNVYVPSIKANSGSRFVCVDTTGKLISQTTPCSGT